MKHRRFLFILPALLIALAGCAAQAEPVQRTTFALGTVCTQTVYASGDGEALTLAGEELLYALDAQLSVHRAQSEVSLINARAGEWTEVSARTFSLIARAKALAEQTGGAFDPTLGVLTKAWDIAGEHPRVPAADEIASLLPLIGWQGIELDEAASCVRICEGQALDLGAIAKGLAADALAEIYRQADARGVISLGGNVYALGAKQDGAPWRVGLRDPLGTAEDYFATLAVQDVSVVVSGAYERYFEQDGKIYHHILDAQTGYPAASGLLCSVVVSADSTLADALSTALFVRGQGGLALAEAAGADALVLTEAGELFATPGFYDQYDFALNEGSNYVQAG